jgi:hypothetical protein
MDSTNGAKAAGKVVTIPVAELAFRAEAALETLNETGRLLTAAEREMLRANLEHYTLDADGVIWARRPPELPGTFRFTERPDLALNPA